MRWIVSICCRWIKRKPECTMLDSRVIVIFSLVLAFLVNVVTADFGGKDKPSCDKCSAGARLAYISRPQSIVCLLAY